MFRSASLAVQSVFNTVTNVAEAAQESISIPTTYVHNRARKMTLLDQERVILETAQELTSVKSALESDSDLQQTYDNLAKVW